MIINRLKYSGFSLFNPLNCCVLVCACAFYTAFFRHLISLFFLSHSLSVSFDHPSFSHSFADAFRISSQSFILSYALAWNTLPNLNTLDSALARHLFGSYFGRCRLSTGPNAKVSWEKNTLGILYTTAYFSYTMNVFFFASLSLSLLSLMLLLLFSFLFFFAQISGTVAKWHTHTFPVFHPISSAFIYFNIMPLISEIICGKFLAHQLQFVICVCLCIYTLYCCCIRVQ